MFCTQPPSCFVFTVPLFVSAWAEKREKKGIESGREGQKGAEDKGRKTFFSIFIRKLMLLNQEPTLMTSYSLNYFLFFKGPISRDVATLGVMILTYKLTGIHSVHGNHHQPNRMLWF